MSYIFRSATAEPAKGDSTFCHLNLIYTGWMSEHVIVDQTLISNPFRNSLFEWVDTLRQLPFIISL
jgi:hypothetical protein